MQRLICFWYLIACLFMTVSTSAAQEQMPDLVPVVVDGDQGVAEIKNIGDIASEPGKVFVICSRIPPGSKRSEPCAEGSHIPGFIEKWNTLPFDVPALKPGASFRFKVFGAGAFERRSGAYGMKIIADPQNRIAEADESNNLARLDAVNGKKPVAVSHAQKKEPGGNINLSITVNREPVRAEIKVVKLGETRYVYWTHYQPGGPALPSPIQLTLPAGTYDIHIKPDGPNLFIEKTMALEIKSGGTLDKSINLQAGHLEVDAQAGAQAVKAPISILQHGVPLIGAPGSFVYTPFNADLAPGHYTLVVTNPKDRWKESVEIRIDAEKTAKKTVIFSKQHAGFIKIRLLMDGQEIPSETFTSFADVKVLDAGNQKEVVPISGGYGAPALLPSGTYDIHVTQHVIGGSKTVFKAIRIVDGQTVDKSVTIPGSGELKLAGRWTHQPTNLADCAHYNNPFNAAHLGALMGGPSVSRGKCLDPVVQKMTMWVSTPGRNDGNVGKIEGYNVPRKLIAGMYDITVWPVDHRELAQTLKGVEIPSGGVVQKELNFRWPDQKR